MTGDDDGFTLIEVLVAFAILASALTGIYAALAESARTQVDLTLRADTLREAQSHLERLIAGASGPGETHGRYDNGTAWRAIVTPLPQFATQPGRLMPARVVLTARDGRGRVLTDLETVALIPRSP